MNRLKLKSIDCDFYQDVDKEEFMEEFTDTRDTNPDWYIYSINVVPGKTPGKVNILIFYFEPKF